MISGTVQVKVGGEYACFTRPEFKVERVSYPVMTPGAARGVLEAILWKPEFRWEVQEIWVLKPIAHMALLRNELSDRQGTTPVFIEDLRQRQQRTSLVLRQAEYVIRAGIRLREHARDPVQKYTEQFLRHVEKGQCHHTPYLGTREFAAWFERPTGDEQPQPPGELDLGTMLFDTAYREHPSTKELAFYRHGATGRRPALGVAERLFFTAKLNNGVLTVPPEKYGELYRLEAENA